MLINVWHYQSLFRGTLKETKGNTSGIDMRTEGVPRPRAVLAMAWLGEPKAIYLERGPKMTTPA